MKFKVGDKVKCMDASNSYLEYGKVYEISNAFSGDYDDYVIFVSGSNSGWSTSRFDLVKDITKTGIDLTECNDYRFPPQSLKIIAEKKETALSLDKKYHTVDTHYPVRIICKDRKDSRLPWVGLYTASCGEEGAIYVNQEGIDLWGKKLIEEVPEVDWSKVVIDTPIWIGADYQPRHFAEFRNNFVYYYTDGRSSHTSNGMVAASKSFAVLTNPNEKT